MSTSHHASLIRHQIDAVDAKGTECVDVVLICVDECVVVIMWYDVFLIVFCVAVVG